MAFRDIKGQDKAVSLLKTYLDNAQLSGAYLFIGPEGVGKYLAARTFAKAVNCQEQEGDSCDLCPSCLKIDKKGHPDVYFIEPTESEAIWIEVIRQLKKDIALRSYEGKFKVFVINDAHRLSPEASNALLKILEEPPKASLIILVTAKPNLLFKTIISRCKAVRFYALGVSCLEGILKQDYHLDTSLAHFLAFFCEGRIGRSLRLNDPSVLRKKNKIIDIFTISGTPQLDELAKESTKEDLRGYLGMLSSWFRDIYLIKAGMPYSGLINLDRRDELLKHMNRYNWFELDEIFKSISDSFAYLDQNLNIKLILSNLRAHSWKEKS